MMLIPIYGLYGAAFATALAMVFEALGLYRMAMRRLGLRLFVFARLAGRRETAEGSANKGDRP